MTAAAPSFAFDEPLHRRYLIRIVEPANPLPLAIGMQNPSTAEAEIAGKDDPTSRRLIDFTHHLGFGRYIGFNPHTRRAAQPAALYRWYENETSLAEREAYKHNALRLAIAICRDTIVDGGKVVAASGNCYWEDPWVRRFWQLIAADNIPLYVFGLTGSGAPIHPMARGKHRLPDAVTLHLWKPT
jgi:hypothetical protein